MTLRFFTDEMAENKDEIVPKQAWAHGMIFLVSNESQGIKSDQINFDSLMEISNKIEDLLIKHGIKIHTTRTAKTKKHLC